MYAIQLIEITALCTAYDGDQAERIGLLVILPSFLSPPPEAVVSA